MARNSFRSRVSPGPVDRARAAPRPRAGRAAVEARAPAPRPPPWWPGRCRRARCGAVSSAGGCSTSPCTPTVEVWTKRRTPAARGGLQQALGAAHVDVAVVRSRDGRRCDTRPPRGPRRRRRPPGAEGAPASRRSPSTQRTRPRRAAERAEARASARTSSPAREQRRQQPAAGVAGGPRERDLQTASTASASPAGAPAAASSRKRAR